MVAPVVGPLLGGWITDNIAWPWIFYINVPVGLAAGLAAWIIYRKRETPTVRVPIDGFGLGLLVIWVGALQVMLDQGRILTGSNPHRSWHSRSWRLSDCSPSVGKGHGEGGGPEISAAE